MKKDLLAALPILMFLLVFTSQIPPAEAKGKFEFGFHYSTWSVNLLKSAIESGLNDALESGFKDKFIKDIQKDYPNFTEKSYTQTVDFDSGGDNYGFEFRWYPGGETGSFSLGVSVEKTSMKISLREVSASLSLEDSVTQKTGSFSGKASGEALIKPLSFHLSFRWDIKPSWRVRPFITFGLGVSTASAIDEATLDYSYSGTLSKPGESPESYQGSETKTGKQLKDEYKADKGKDFPLPFVPFIQLSLGLKGAITENLYLLVDAGVWDGFILRGGVALRF